jgi:hypothetical protein
MVIKNIGKNIIIFSLIMLCIVLSVMFSEKMLLEETKIFTLISLSKI